MLLWFWYNGQVPSWTCMHWLTLFFHAYRGGIRSLLPRFLFVRYLFSIYHGIRLKYQMQWKPKILYLVLAWLLLEICKSVADNFLLLTKFKLILSASDGIAIRWLQLITTRIEYQEMASQTWRDSFGMEWNEFILITGNIYGIEWNGMYIIYLSKMSLVINIDNNMG